jgi:hypothetical protein
LLHLGLALANVGNRFPTWEEILVIVVVDVLLITWAGFMIRRGLRRSRRASRKTSASQARPPVATRGMSEGRDDPAVSDP